MNDILSYFGQWLAWWMLHPDQVHYAMVVLSVLLLFSAVAVLFSIVYSAKRGGIMIGTWHNRVQETLQGIIGKIGSSLKREKTTPTQPATEPQSVTAPFKKVRQAFAAKLTPDPAVPDKLDNIHHYVELIALSMTNIQRRVSAIDEKVLHLEQNTPPEPLESQVLRERVAELAAQGQSPIVIAQACRISYSEVEILMAMRAQAV